MAGRTNKSSETPVSKKKSASYQVQITGQMFGTKWNIVTGNDIAWICLRKVYLKLSLHLSSDFLIEDE